MFVVEISIHYFLLFYKEKIIIKIYIKKIYYYIYYKNIYKIYIYNNIKIKDNNNIILRNIKIFIKNSMKKCFLYIIK